MPTLPREQVESFIKHQDCMSRRPCRKFIARSFVVASQDSASHPPEPSWTATLAHSFSTRQATCALHKQRSNRTILADREVTPTGTGGELYQAPGLYVSAAVPQVHRALEEQEEPEDTLMDLLYFVVDILQFQGERNAYDEGWNPTDRVSLQTGK
jgi:hypothetical protein